MSMQKKYIFNISTIFMSVWNEMRKVLFALYLPKVLHLTTKGWVWYDSEWRGWKLKIKARSFSFDGIKSKQVFTFVWEKGNCELSD